MERWLLSVIVLLVLAVGRSAIAQQAVEATGAERPKQAREAAVAAPAAPADGEALELARQMAEAYGRLTELELRYSTEVPLQPGQRLLQEERYLRKVTHGGLLERHEYEFVVVQMATGRRRVATSRIESFDGRRFMSLDRLRDERGLKRGLVAAAGDADSVLREGNMHQAVWSLNGRSYSDWLAGADSDVQIVERTRLDGVDVVVIEGTVLDGEARARLWVAPERGYLPLIAQLRRAEDGEPLREVRLGKLEEVAPGLWYPRLVRSGRLAADPATKPDAFVVVRASPISVRPLREEVFVSRFPLGTFVTDRVSSTAYFAAAGSRGVTMLWCVLGGVGVAVLAVVAGLRLGRRRRGSTVDP